MVANPIETSNDILIQPVGFEMMPAITEMNRLLFDEERVINRFDRPDLVILLASVDGEAAGFKIGYGLDRGIYYSAKGGVLDRFRRRGIAGRLLENLMDEAFKRGYRTYCFDTFPNMHPGMTILGVSRGFSVTEVRYSDVYKDLRVRFSVDLPEREYV